MGIKDRVELSIVIVTYKSRDSIPECVRSLLQSVQGLSCEVIVVDNASEDGVADYIRKEFHEVTVVENEENEGFARALNRGVSIATGRYLAILNPDIRLDLGTLKALLNRLKEHPDSIVGPRAVDEKGRTLASCRSLPHIGNILKYPVSLFLRGKKLRKPRRFLLDLWDHHENIDVTDYEGYLMGTCLVTSLDFFKKMGMFDQRYFLYCEDADLGLRVLKGNHQAFFVSDATIVHRGGQSTGQNPLSPAYFILAYLHYIRKNLSVLHKGPYEICLFFYALAEIVEAWGKGNKTKRIGLWKSLRYFVSWKTQRMNGAFLEQTDEPKLEDRAYVFSGGAFCRNPPIVGGHALPNGKSLQRDAGRMEIGWIEVLRKVHGEMAYNHMAQSILSAHYDLDIINAGLDHFKKYLYPTILSRLCKVSGEKEIWIRNFDSMLTLPYDRTKGKNIAVIHHIDHSLQPAYLKPSWIAMEKVFYHHLKKINAIVTVSKYWQNYFQERGYRRVYLIYNAFDTDQFHFQTEEILEFKKRFRLEGKPIVYLGNCQRIKGVVEAYEQLKEMDIHLVTSGRKEVNIPALNLDLNYREYLSLLKSSSAAVIMSKFKEGWNRTAHEAMLCKTPVIGSGLGGMKELLEGGSQVICSDFGVLKEKVTYVLDHPELGERGYEFASQFTVRRFNEEWLNLIERVNEEE